MRVSRCLQFLAAVKQHVLAGPPLNRRQAQADAAAVLSCTLAAQYMLVDFCPLPLTTMPPCAGAALATALAQLSAASAAAVGGRQRARLPWPLYLIGTRDSFTTALLQQTDQVGGCMLPGWSQCRSMRRPYASGACAYLRMSQASVQPGCSLACHLAIGLSCGA